VWYVHVPIEGTTQHGICQLDRIYTYRVEERYIYNYLHVDWEEGTKVTYLRYTRLFSAGVTVTTGLFHASAISCMYLTLHSVLL
jgi:hypothetical protein